jgi:hypothetical protein
MGALMPAFIARTRRRLAAAGDPMSLSPLSSCSHIRCRGPGNLLFITW